MPQDSFDWLIVGAGFAGSVLAERLARGLDQKILLIDQRDHVGGNAHDCVNGDGLLYHAYGPHIFHTNSDTVFDYLTQFTDWRPYEHRVRAIIDGKLVPLPINLNSVNQIYGLDLDSRGLEQFFRERASGQSNPSNAEDAVVCRVGRDLFEKVYAGYTKKHWGVHARDLDKSVTLRLPVRFDTNDCYFSDKYQMMPKEGYSGLFAGLLSHDNITVRLSTRFEDVKESINYRNLIYTGRIDEYFGHSFGKLPYRHVRFDHQVLDQEWFQPVGVVNYPGSEPYTRITEHKYLTGQSHRKTILSFEYPGTIGIEAYPFPNKEAHSLYDRYRSFASANAKNVWFVGRLATYQYLNMDQVVGQALATFQRIKRNN